MLSAGSHEHPLAMACELGAHLTKHLRLLQEPLKHLPLAVWRAEGSERESFVFPTSTGLWVMGQKATEASVFLMSHLLEHHKQLLTKGQVRLLTTSTPFLQSLLRCLKPNLPRKDAIIRSQAAVAHTRLALRDGWVDTDTMEFHPLPFKSQHMVFQPALPYCYAELEAISLADLEEAHAMFASYLPVQKERCWLLTFLGRCLCPPDGCKAVVVLTDSLGAPQGNAGKSSLLAWIQACLGTNSCVLNSGQALTNACTTARTVTAKAHTPCQPLIRMFDELSRCNGKAQALQLNYGAIKHMSSGLRQQPATIISANLSDLPDLRQLHTQDVSFVNRLVLLPARGRFVITDSFDSCCLDRLTPALAKVLLDAFKDYKRAGSKLLQVPASMQQFKRLVIRASVLSSMNSTDAMVCKAWVQRHLVSDHTSQGDALPKRLVTDMFLLHWNGHDGVRNRRNRSEALGLLDAALAECGICASESDHDYLHVAWSKNFGTFSGDAN